MTTGRSAEDGRPTHIWQLRRTAITGLGLSGRPVHPDANEANLPSLPFPPLLRPFPPFPSPDLLYLSDALGTIKLRYKSVHYKLV